MIKRWMVKCKVNMDASCEVNVIVSANTLRKAEIKAIDECKKKGYLNPQVNSCKEITEKLNNIGDVV
jgi:hypothetical protein